MRKGEESGKTAQPFSLTPAQVEAFEARTDRGERPNGCWLWTGSLSPQGYGSFAVSGRKWPAHRVTLAQQDGFMPTRSIHCCHRCDNPPCVNPAHLFWGTASDNLRDASAKKRLVNNQKTHCPYGHPYAGDNLKIVNGGRNCLACQRDRGAEYRLRKRIGNGGPRSPDRLLAMQCFGHSPDAEERLGRLGAVSKADALRAIEQAQREAIEECAKRALNLYIAPKPRSRAAQFHERNVKAIIHDELMKLVPHREG